MEKLTIAVIGKAQGIKGEVKVNPITDDVERFKSLKQVYAGNVILTIERVKCLNNGVFIKFKGVDDRNTAETLKNIVLEIDRKDAQQLEEGRYYIVDIIGSSVVADGVELGKLVEVLQHGSADIYQVNGEKNFMFPALKDVIVDVDIKSKIVTLDSARLKEVIVYED